MLQTLENSERFRKEFSDFKERISKITNDRARQDAEGLLNNLLKEVRTIDIHHQDLFARKEIPTMAVDTRSNITEIRKAIMKKLEDWEKSIAS